MQIEQLALQNKQWEKERITVILNPFQDLT